MCFVFCRATVIPLTTKRSTVWLPYKANSILVRVHNGDPFLMESPQCLFTCLVFKVGFSLVSSIYTYLTFRFHSHLGDLNCGRNLRDSNLREAFAMPLFNGTPITLRFLPCNKSWQNRGQHTYQDSLVHDL